MTINMALVNSSLATVDLNSTMVFSLGADKREPERLWEGRDSEDFVGIAPLPSPPPPSNHFPPDRMPYGANIAQKIARYSQV